MIVPWTMSSKLYYTIVNKTKVNTAILEFYNALKNALIYYV